MSLHRNPSSTEFAWAVGVFEGEGWIVRQGESNRHNIGLEMTDLDIVERVASAFGVTNTVSTRHRQENWKRIHSWVLSSAPDAKELLEDMLPLLGERRAAAARAAIPLLAKVRTASLPVAEHGTVSRYTSRKWLCRCEPCSDAMKAYHKAYRKRPA